MILSELKTKLTKKENDAINIDLEISFSKDKMREEQDPAHIVFWNDHLAFLNYQLDLTNCEIYLLRQKLKILENAEKINPN